MDQFEEIAHRSDEIAPPEVAPSAVRAALAPRGAAEGGPDAIEPSLEVEWADEPAAPVEPAAPIKPVEPVKPVESVATEAPAEEEGAAPAEPDVFAHVPIDTRVEALLFASAQPLSLKRLQSLLGDVPAPDVRAAIARLEELLADRSFGVQEVAGGYQLRTRPELAPYVARLGRRVESDRLSSAALETLAVVAYRQPVLRADVENIRGVASGEMLRTLIEKALVRVTGRADLPGAPLLYGTTPRFLEVFGLRDLKDLPADRELLQRPL